MNEDRIRVRLNRSAGELEVEGPENQVARWWEKLWPQLVEVQTRNVPAALRSRPIPDQSNGHQDLPEIFGEYFSEFRGDVTDVDKILIAASFVQAREPERVFSTKAANQLLVDQNIKVANASESVRRLKETKRVFVVSDGRFRVSATGLEHLKTLKTI